MKKTYTDSSMLVMIFPLLAILLPIIAKIVAHFVLNTNSFFLELGETGLVCLASLLILMAILPIALNKHSPVGSVIFGSVAFLLSLTVVGLMFCVAFTKSKVVIFTLSNPKQLTVERASKMIKMLDANKKVILMLTTRQIYHDAIRNGELDKTLQAKLNSKNLFLNKTANLLEIIRVFKMFGLRQKNMSKFEIQPGKSFKNVLNSLKTYKVSEVLARHARGCLVVVYLNNESQFKKSLSCDIKNTQTNVEPKNEIPVPTTAVNIYNKQKSRQRIRNNEQQVSQKENKMKKNKNQLSKELEPLTIKDNLFGNLYRDETRKNSDLVSDGEICVTRIADSTKITMKNIEELGKSIASKNKVGIIFLTKQHYQYLVDLMNMQFPIRTFKANEFEEHPLSLLAKTLRKIGFKLNGNVFEDSYKPSGWDINLRMNKPRVRNLLLAHFEGCCLILFIKDDSQFQTHPINEEDAYNGIPSIAALEGTFQSQDQEKSPKNIPVAESQNESQKPVGKSSGIFSWFNFNTFYIIVNGLRYGCRSLARFFISYY